MGELVPQGLVAVHDLGRDGDGVHRGMEQPACLEVEQLPGDVRTGEIEVVVALPGRERLMQLTGLGIDEVGSERSGVAAEQGVRQ